MSGADNFRKISTDLREMTHYAEEQRLGRGRIEFDELGNAIWVPSTAAVSGDVMLRLLNKKQYKKKKDLRKLSDWIQSRKPKED